MCVTYTTENINAYFFDFLYVCDIPLTRNFVAKTTTMYCCNNYLKIQQDRSNVAVLLGYSYRCFVPVIIRLFQAECLAHPVFCVQKSNVLELVNRGVALIRVISPLKILIT
jgi:hypothetical protein